MHDHETCEQLMAAARRTGHMGRLEYLAIRCDMTHGRLEKGPKTSSVSSGVGNQEDS